MKTQRNNKAKQKVLNFLLDNPEEKFYLTQIAGETAVADSTAQHILENQLGQNFLEKQKVGNLSYYRLKIENPSVRQAKISRTVQEIADLVEKLKDVSKKIILFGSCARGEDTGESDIDLFILSNDKETTQQIISKTRAKRRITAIIKTYPEWVVLKEKKKYLYEEINKGQILWEERYG